MGLKVGVVGAGVVGLSTALQLQRQLRDCQVTLLADQFRRDTTSDGAAGIFRPGTSFSVGSESMTRKVIVESYQAYRDLLEQHDCKATGVSEISGYLFSSTSPNLVRNHLIERVVPTYRPVTESELRICPGTWKYGSYFTTILTECRQLLPFYEHRFLANNGKIVDKRITSLNDLKEENFDVIFNCMGFGAKEVFKDHKLVPIRGQVIKVSASWLKNFFYADYDTYIIPGQESVTLGGCRNYDSYDLTPSRHDSAAIMERCGALVPRLLDAPVLRTWVGLRPHRDPVRIEPEVVSIAGKPTKVVHNYGHGGYGVTTAPGSASYAINLFQETHRRVSKL